MYQAVPQRRPVFVDHTPKDFELPTFPLPGSAVSMNAHKTTTGTVGPNADTNEDTNKMGQSQSAAEREEAARSLRKPSTTILREDTIHISSSSGDEDAATTLRASAAPTPDSFSMHFDCTSQPPYSSRAGDKMMTQTSLLALPKGNESHDLAYFLRTTGPCVPHRRPSKLGQRDRDRGRGGAGGGGPGGKMGGTKKALRFFGLGGARRTPAGVEDAHARLNQALFKDEGSHLNPYVKQRTTSHGKQYLALNVPTLEEQPQENKENRPPHTSGLSPIAEKRHAADCHDILESRVSISFASDTSSTPNDPLDDWLLTLNKDRSSRMLPGTPMPLHPSNGSHASTVRLIGQSSSPVRPAASSPPTPEPASAVSTISMAESYQHALNEHPAKRSLDSNRALSSHPLKVAPNVGAPRAKLALPKEEFPFKHVRSGKEVDIKHPSPRRFASHPVLLQRASSMASTLYPRSVSDSPGPPPPRSPLRLRRDPRNIESVLIVSDSTRSATPKVAPSILNVNEFISEVEPIKPTVTTECTGPLSRPESRGKDKGLSRHTANPMSRKAREERIRARKIRDRPTVPRNIDTIMSGPSGPAPHQPAPPPPPPPPAPRQRLRKIRPQITIPELRPAPLATRTSSTASSNASFRKITESTLTPVSSVSSQITQIDTSCAEEKGYTPTSATASQRTASSNMTLSPVMLVAEEVPVPKARSTPKPAKLILKEGKSYAPRPRSASIPRNALNRRSRTAATTPSSRTRSPAPELQKEDTPPLPSPPPNRALPPTPPASGSEKVLRGAGVYSTSTNTNPSTSTSKKELPPPPAAYEIAPRAPSAPKKTSHVSSQDQRLSTLLHAPNAARGGSSKPQPHPTAQKHATAAATSGARASNIDARLEALEKQNQLLQAALWAVLRTNGDSNSAVTAPAAPGSSAAVVLPSAWESRIARRSAASQRSGVVQSQHQASSSNGSALEMYMSTRRGG